MPIEVVDVLQAGSRSVPLARRAPGARSILLIGATGALGAECLRRLAGRHRFERTLVLVKEPVREGMGGVELHRVDPGAPIVQWPSVEADIALVLFEPARLYHQRERALYTPGTADLPALAAWLRRGGTRTLMVVQPHDEGRLPQALRRGLADLDELALATAGFERLLLLRAARKVAPARPAALLARLAGWMLSIGRYMVPENERPVHPRRLAQLIDHALRLAPAGVHVAAPEQLWAAGREPAELVARRWLGPADATGN